MPPQTIIRSRNHSLDEAEGFDKGIDRVGQKQMRVIEIPNELLMGKDVKCFNCSVVEHNSKLYLLYRYEPYNTYITELAMSELDNNFMPVGATKKIRPPRQSSKISTMDDPRAFSWGNEIWFTHAQGCLDNFSNWSCSLVLSHVDTSGNCRKSYLPDFGDNVNYATAHKPVKMEKNWSPFLHNGVLHMVYMISPLRVITFDPIYKTVKEVKSISNSNIGPWFKGKPFGGTPLIPRNQSYFGIFHSFTVGDPSSPSCRTYHMGAYTIKETSEGWLLDTISQKPLVSAEFDDKKDMRNMKSPWRPNCIYPCGIIERKGKVYISCGWQDNRCWIYEFEWDEIEKGMVSL